MCIQEGESDWGKGGAVFSTYLKIMLAAMVNGNIFTRLVCMDHAAPIFCLHKINKQFDSNALSQDTLSTHFGQVKIAVIFFF